MGSKGDKEDGEVESEHVVQYLHGNGVPIFVRITSERIMMFARQKWAREHGLKAAHIMGFVMLFLERAATITATKSFNVE